MNVNDWRVLEDRDTGRRCCIQDGPFDKSRYREVSGANYYSDDYVNIAGEVLSDCMEKHIVLDGGEIVRLLREACIDGSRIYEFVRLYSNAVC